VPRIIGLATAVLTGLAWETLFAAAASVPEAGACREDKGIERTLGRQGYRVVVSGGSATGSGGAVKVQIWERDDGQWVITETFVEGKQTCVVRSGNQLHMLY